MGFEAAIAAATRRVAAATAEMRFGLAPRALERHYRPDQPRVPAGTPEGGQWTDDGGESRQREAVARYGRIVFHGVAIRQNYNSKLDVTECSFHDWEQEYTFVRTWPGKIDCPIGSIY